MKKGDKVQFKGAGHLESESMKDHYAVLNRVEQYVISDYYGAFTPAIVYLEGLTDPFHADMFMVEGESDIDESQDLLALYKIERELTIEEKKVFHQYDKFISKLFHQSHEGKGYGPSDFKYDMLHMILRRQWLIDMMSMGYVLYLPDTQHQEYDDLKNNYSRDVALTMSESTVGIIGEKGINKIAQMLADRDMIIRSLQETKNDIQTGYDEIRADNDKWEEGAREMESKINDLNNRNAIMYELLVDVRSISAGLKHKIDSKMVFQPVSIVKGEGEEKLIKQIDSGELIFDIKPGITEPGLEAKKQRVITGTDIVLKDSDVVIVHMGTIPFKGKDYHFILNRYKDGFLSIQLAADKDTRFYVSIDLKTKSIPRTPELVCIMTNNPDAVYLYSYLMNHKFIEHVSQIEFVSGIALCKVLTAFPVN